MTPVKDGTPPARQSAEILAFSIAVGVVNWFFPGDPGFLKGFFNPYVTLSLLIAVSHGKYYGFLSLAFSAVVAGAALPVALSIAAGTGISLPSGSLAALGKLASLPIAAAIVEVYLLGIIRDSLTRKDRKAREILVSLSRDKGLLKRQVRALRDANLELEERISRQEDSITSLYSQVQVLGALNLNKALGAILEMTARFAGATRCSIWQHRPADGNLALVVGKGWEASGDARTILPDEGTIEGWVVRNNAVFSVKMLLSNESLARMDTGRNIITMPIAAGRRIWGVLNIEEMPFARYNLYSERMLMVIMALAAPGLGRAIEFDSVVHQEDINPVTGLPSFPELYAMLQLELARLRVETGTLAVLIVELANFDELAQEYGREQAMLLIRDVARLVQDTCTGQASVFHYKTPSQLAVLYPRLDADGASLFSLTMLEKVSAAEWRVKEQRVYLEVVLGFSALTGPGQSADELLEAAQSLLEMQKV
jgi:GGDEF domain-containing protein